MNITLQPRRFARRTDHISRGTITKDVPGPRYMEKGITPPTHPLRSLATLLPFDGCGPHGGRGSTSGPFQALRLTLRPFPGPSSRPLTAPLGLFRGVLLADAKHPLAHAKLRLSGCPWRIVFAPARQAPKQRSLFSTLTLRAAFDLVGRSGSPYQPSTSPADKAQ